MSGFSEQLHYLPDYLGGHLRLTLIALSAGVIISVPLGIIATRFKKLESSILGVASVIQTIPGLALLAIMVPLLNMIGIIPALIALTLYSLLPILRNTVVGIREIDADIIQAGQGIGMTDSQLLRMVQLPLALPVIVAGLRTSAVWVVGIATLSTPVGAVSLGNYIFSGLQTRNNMAILFGCVAAAVLALVLDGLIHALEIGIRERKRSRSLLSISGFVVIVIVAIFLGTGSHQASKKQTIKIGGKPFTEQYILTNFLSDYIQKDLDYSTKLVPNLGSTVAFDALKSNQIDVYVDYSGTLWNMHLKNREMPTNPDTLLRNLRTYLKQKFDVPIAAKLGFENAYCLAMRGSQARKLGIQSITDLSNHASQLVMGADVEFFGRPEWTRLKSEYNLHFKNTRSMDAVLMYEAVKNDNVDVISAYTTDGRINAFNLTILEDPLHVFPPYDAVVLVSPKASKNPQLMTSLGKLTGKISANLMRTMNMRVDIQRKSPQAVAQALLDSLNFEQGK